jgi:hypothetical protein
MEQKLAEMGSKIDELKAKASQASAERKEELDQHIHQLQEKREAMQQRLHDLQESSGEAWDEVKSGFHSAWDELNQAFEKAREQFK